MELIKPLTSRDEWHETCVLAVKKKLAQVRLSMER